MSTIIKEEADEETGDEVKVFRTDNTDDGTDMASSTAELIAAKKDLALEAEIESQTEQNEHRIPPMQSSKYPPSIPPSPNRNFLGLLGLSPMYPPHPLAAAAVYAVANSPVFQAAAKNLNNLANMFASNSPNYHQLGSGGCFPGSHQSAFLPPNPQMQNPALFNLIYNQHQLSQTPPQQQLQQQHTPKSYARPYERPGSSTHNANSSRQSASQQTPKREKPLKASAMTASEKREREKTHVKKPCNAFMVFMRMNRQKVLAEEGQKQSAVVNQKLGAIWQHMSKEEQKPYYDISMSEREDHLKQHPNWSARENYAIHKKKKKKREKDLNENNENKKCRARFGTEHQEKWCKHCRRKKRCLNVRQAESPIVTSTTSSTTPLSLYQEQQHPLNLMNNNHPSLNSPASSAMMSEKRSESAFTSCSEAGAPSPAHSVHHQQHLNKYRNAMPDGGPSSSNSNASSSATTTNMMLKEEMGGGSSEEIPKPTPTHPANVSASAVAASAAAAAVFNAQITAAGLNADQFRHFMGQPSFFPPNFYPNALLGSPSFNNYNPTH